jgi:hypothetical protein
LFHGISNTSKTSKLSTEIGKTKREKKYVAIKTLLADGGGGADGASKNDSKKCMIFFYLSSSMVSEKIISLPGKRFAWELE